MKSHVQVLSLILSLQVAMAPAISQASSSGSETVRRERIEKSYSEFKDKYAQYLREKYAGLIEQAKNLPKQEVGAGLQAFEKISRGEQADLNSTPVLKKLMDTLMASDEGRFVYTDFLVSRLKDARMKESVMSLALTTSLFAGTAEFLVCLVKCGDMDMRTHAIMAGVTLAVVAGDYLLATSVGQDHDAYNYRTVTVQDSKDILGRFQALQNERDLILDSLARRAYLNSLGVKGAL